MSPIATSFFAFLCAFGGALLGMFLRRVLPEHHMSPESKDVVRVGMGLVASTLALVLGLLVYSWKSFYDTQTNEVTQLAANVVMLDRVLAHYGTETAEIRDGLKRAIEHQIDMMWSENSAHSAGAVPVGMAGEVLLDKIHELTPKDDRQKHLQSQAVNLALQVGQMRLLMYEQRSVPVPKLLLILLVFWLTVLFISFGLFAPANYTVIASLFFSAIAICGAVFLLTEMYFPYGGLIQVPSAPLHSALEQLGR